MVDHSNLHPFVWRQSRPYADAIISLGPSRWEEGAQLIETACRKVGRYPANLDSEAMGAAVVSRFWAQSRNAVVIVPELWRMIESSGAEDIPLSAIKLPHSFMFLGAPRGNGLRLSGDEENEFCGAYINKSDTMLSFGLVFRSWTVSTRKQNWPAVFDCVSFIQAGISPKLTLDEWLSESASASGSICSPGLLPDLRKALEVVLNCLCYLSTEPPIETEWSSAPPAKMLRVLAEGSARKRAVARADVERLGILPISVLGREIARATSKSADTGEVAPHWRRGHFHTYWTGKGRAIPAVRWVRPVIVNADKGAPQGVHIHPVVGAAS